MRHPALLSLAAALATATACAQTSATPSTGPQGQQQAAPVVRATPKSAAMGSSGSTGSAGSPGAKSATGAVPVPQPGKPSTILTQSFSVPASKKPAPSTTPAPPRPAAASTGAVQRPATPNPPVPSPKPQAPAAQTAAPQTPSASAPPAQPATGILNKNIVVLDASHGGVDGGSRIGDSLQEKEITLAFAFKLRSLLTARGFTVVMTRDTDAAAPANNPGSPLTLDDRAGIANHARASACLLIHATGSGTGVHLYTSELDATPGEATVLPWLTAQTAWVDQSKKLAEALSAALKRSHFPLVSSSASIRPVDSMTCPALVLELAPQNGDDETTIKDTAYQQQIAEAIAATLVFWKNQVQAPVKLAPPEKTDTTTAGATP